MLQWKCGKGAESDRSGRVRTARWHLALDPQVQYQGYSGRMRLDCRGHEPISAGGEVASRRSHEPEVCVSRDAPPNHDGGRRKDLLPRGRSKERPDRLAVARLSDVVAHVPQLDPVPG